MPVRRLTAIIEMSVINFKDVSAPEVITHWNVIKMDFAALGSNFHPPLLWDIREPIK
jgi:hypothetical protein